MAIILHIDTALEQGSVGLTVNSELHAVRETASQKEHASFLQPAIAEMCKETGIALQQLDAVSVSIGPGSYTGLRVGLASAKGLCYALGKPLITVGTLPMMALAAMEQSKRLLAENGQPVLFCPMIDARRMEVFTAVYDQALNEIAPPQALIIDGPVFADWLQTNVVVFSGNGAFKLSNISRNNNSIIIDIHHDIQHLAALAEQQFVQQSFADTAYCEPFYLKPFYTTMHKNNY